MSETAQPRPVVGYAAVRAYLQAPIDQADLTVAAIDAGRQEGWCEFKHRARRLGRARGQAPAA